MVLWYFPLEDDLAPVRASMFVVTRWAGGGARGVEEVTGDRDNAPARTGLPSPCACPHIFSSFPRVHRPLARGGGAPGPWQSTRLLLGHNLLSQQYSRSQGMANLTRGLKELQNRTASSQKGTSIGCRTHLCPCLVQQDFGSIYISKVK